MERIILTGDGSHSLYSAHFDQQYHSLHGALEESEHIYINLGLRPILEFDSAPALVHVFEMGFGTGLNAFLAWKLADEVRKPVHFVSVEAYPVPVEEAAALNYETLTGESDFLKLHESPWSEDYRISPFFTLRKEKVLLEDFRSDEIFDVVFYDAFDPRAQPELWTAEIFAKLAAQCRPGAVLVTYSSKGIVKRALAAGGFDVKRHKGPPRKTHVLRATRR